MEQKMHPFQVAGLGQFPYKYKGMTEMLHIVPGCAPRAGGSCCYCGTGIRYAFHFESADGKKFHVGSDCVEKSGDNGLIKIVSEEVRRLNAKKRMEKKAEKAIRDADYTNKNLEIVKDKLITKPHPNTWFADQGKTLLDYVDFFIKQKKFDITARIIKENI